MDDYSIDYYSDAVIKDLDQWPLSLRVRYTKLVERMKIYGSNLGEPHTKAFGEGLFELRVKGDSGIGRVFYCTVIGKRIVMLHSFIKKTQKTPQKEIAIAVSRLKEIKHER